MAKSEAVAVSISRNSNNQINVRIKDVSSGLAIVELTMEPEQFAECVTGLAFSPGIASFVPNEYTTQRYGMMRITKHVECDKAAKEEQRCIVLEDFTNKYAPHDWEIHDDGIRTQQPGSKHQYVIRKFVTQAEAKRMEDNLTL